MERADLLRLALRDRRTSAVEKTLLKESAARRDTFAAAMEQFEELMRAAASVSPHARPIPLYYAMAQAGLGIAAAHKPNPWGFSRHGLQVSDVSPNGLSSVKVSPEGIGGFQVVSEPAGSLLMTQASTLGALVASVPELLRLKSNSGEKAPLALDIFHHNYTDFDDANDVVVSVFINEKPPGRARYAATLSEMLRRYPSVAGYKVSENAESYQEVNDRRWKADVTWPKGSGASIDSIAPEYLHRNDRSIRPSVVEDSATLPPSLLMTWWAILFASSILSRYHPRVWTKALRVDHSEDAVPLELCLEEALTVVPHLVVEALDAKPLLFAKPLQL